MNFIVIHLDVKTTFLTIYTEGSLIFKNLKINDSFMPKCLKIITFFQVF
jgi:hypothetical protein